MENMSYIEDWLKVKARSSATGMVDKSAMILPVWELALENQHFCFFHGWEIKGHPKGTITKLGYQTDIIACLELPQLFFNEWRFQAERQVKSS
jgi:hypothetical protein